LTSTPGRSVVVLANRLPYPVDDGWKTRTYHIIEGLLRHASVTLLVFHDGPHSDVDAFRADIGGELDVIVVQERRGYTPLRLLLGLITRTPVYVWTMRSRRYRQELERLAAELKPEAVVAELSYMYPYLESLPPHITRVIDTHNIDSVVLSRYARRIPGRLRRAYARITAAKLSRYERRVFGAAHQVWVCSGKEEDLVRRMAPGANVRTVPNGVDTRRFQPAPDEQTVAGRLLFFGRMDYEPNLDAVTYFAREILPLLRRTHPNIELWVVGAGIGDELKSLTRAAPELRMIGRVDDLRPVVAEAQVVVVPLRMGGGTRLKILEALALGKAMVSTSVGAEGLALQSGSDLLMADKPEDFAAAVGRLLDCERRRRELGRHGRDSAVRLYDWRSIHDLVAAGLGWKAAS
jgi:polysaccharide biosynthesis protein PslH